MDTDSFIVYIETVYIYKDIAEDVKTRFDSSNYELNRLLPKGKNKKVIGLMKNELGGKTMTKFVELRTETYSYLIDDDSEDQKAKSTKKCVIKRKIKFENYKNCLEATQLYDKIKHLENNEVTQIVLKAQQRLKSERHNAFTEEINETALSLSDDKRMQSFHSVETYAYGTSKDIVSEKEVIK